MKYLKKNSPESDSSWNKEDCKIKTSENISKIKDLVEKLYAERKQAVLIVLQGMDASGKDGLTRDVFSEVSPTWIHVNAFKKPSDLEMSHDFLWRIHSKLPEKGTVGIFNRSHYEDILVPSVYKILDKRDLDKRYEQINDFEKMLEDNGTKIIKCYMNLSYEKQEEKLMERVNDPTKHWKHSDGDWESREHWTEFMEVYEEIFEKCGTIPWHFIPCDKNWTRNYIASQLIRETLEKLNPQYPSLVSERFKKIN